VCELSGFFLQMLNFVFHYVFMCALPRKPVPEMTYTVSGRTLNPTHSLTHFWETLSCMLRYVYWGYNLTWICMQTAELDA